MSQTLHEGCTISDDCSTITCKMNFVEKPITFKLKVSITAPLETKAPVQVVQFLSSLGSEACIPSVFNSELYDRGKTMEVKVKLLAGGKVLGKGVYPVKVTVMEGDLPISTNDCGMFKWWYDLSDATKAAVIGGPLLVICILVIYCCCCRSRPANQGAVLATPAVLSARTFIKVASNTRPCSKLGGTTLNGREEGGQYYFSQTCDQERFEAKKVGFFLTENEGFRNFSFDGEFSIFTDSQLQQHPCSKTLTSFLKSIALNKAADFLQVNRADTGTSQSEDFRRFHEASELFCFSLFIIWYLFQSNRGIVVKCRSNKTAGITCVI
ncbi:unnamed protein product [Porites lobata]|uniref:Uncharacterized protein n=1 Tax=Porites lobata TaxID=104759 RepID=A0ABN8Q6T7_9CNID|nr:unnamed protein product [Porites lobata]